LRQLPTAERHDNQQRATEIVHGMPTDWHPMVPDRLGPTEGNGLDIPHGTLHIALLTSDLRLYEQAKKGFFIIKPPLWEGEVKLHVLLKNPKLSAEDYALKLAAVDLGLVDPSVAQLNDGQQIDIGWPTDES
jgi:hypothetical protein